MNTRCYRCGWSFSLSREEIEAAVAAALAAGDKIHAERCPHCRQVIKMPIDQLRRALPAGWAPADRLVAVEATPNPAAQARELEPASATGAAAAPAATAPTKRRHHRSAGAAPAVEAPEKAPEVKARSGKPAAGRPAAKKTARKQSKP